MSSSSSDVTQRRSSTRDMTTRDMMEVVCNIIREMSDSKGVTANKVCRFVEQRYSDLPRVNRAKLRAAMQRAVQQGYLVSSGNKYNLNKTTSCGSCVCKPTRKQRKRKKAGFIERLMKIIFKKNRCKSRKKKRRPSTTGTTGA